jgi:hypothetical protein
MEKLKGWDKLLHGSGGNTAGCHDTVMQELFMHKGFLERVVRWIAVDDQVCLIFVYCGLVTNAMAFITKH